MLMISACISRVRVPPLALLLSCDRRPLRVQDRFAVRVLSVPLHSSLRSDAPGVESPRSHSPRSAASADSACASRQGAAVAPKDNMANYGEWLVYWYLRLQASAS
jgi:hypothetical protein